MLSDSNIILCLVLPSQVNYAITISKQVVDLSRVRQIKPALAHLKAHLKYIESIEYFIAKDNL